MTQVRERFVIVRNAYHPPAVILADWRYWTDHEQELDQWCGENHARRQGMTVEMTEESLTAFVLRWS
jgi:hypothetical protein